MLERKLFKELQKFDSCEAKSQYKFKVFPPQLNWIFVLVKHHNNTTQTSKVIISRNLFERETVFSLYKIFSLEPDLRVMV